MARRLSKEKSLTRKTNKRYVAGANLEREIATYFRTEGFIATRAAGSRGLFDVVAVNGLTVWMIQSKKGASEEAADQLVEYLTVELQGKFPLIQYPIVVMVATGMKDRKPLGSTRLLVPKDTTVGGVHAQGKKDQ